MKIYSYEYPLEKEEYNRISLVPEGTIFFDIETTGLKKESSLLTIIGCGYYEEDILHIIQWFNDDAISEEIMLRAFLSFLQDHQGPILSFNGDGFDLPFLTAHMEYNDLTTPWELAIANRECIDLYKILRGFTPAFSLKNGKQKSWESFLGIQRDDTMDGGRLIPVYKEYLKTKKDSDLHLMLLHNMEDVKGLSEVSVLLAYDQLRHPAFHILSLEETNMSLSFYLEYDKPFPKEFTVDSELGSMESVDEHHLLVTILFVEDKMYHFYPNHKDYFYLPAEDRAVHKSIGCYVEKEHRQKATAKNCYIPLESQFFPIPPRSKRYGFYVDFEKENQTTYYQKMYHEKDKYISFEDLFPKQEISDITRNYLCDMIKSILIQ